MIGVGGIGAVAPQNTVGNGVGGATSWPFASAETTPGASVADSFAAALADAASRAVDTLGYSEQVSAAAMQGKADTRDVVDAVMSAEQTLTAAVAIRDKIVAAYLEVSRMGI